MTPISDAATVILLRDGTDSVEAFFLRRHASSVFMAGAYVFPGGRVEAGDYQLPDALVDDPQIADRALRTAAVRETFEESGVLLATFSDGTPVTTQALQTEVAKQIRVELQSRDLSPDWAGWLASEGLILSLSDLVFTSWWITPPGNSRRFDTRFYLAALPQGQSAWHDGVEMTDSFWMNPEQAVAAAGRREVMIVPPTLQNLQSITAPTVNQVLTGRRSSQDPVAISPAMRTDDQGQVWVTSPDLEQDLPMP